MSNTTFKDTKTQNTLSGKGNCWKKYVSQVKGAPRKFREAALENQITPLWPEDQKMSVAPIQAITMRKGLNANEKLILCQIITAAPDFVHNVGTIKTLLSCSEKTAQRWLNSLLVKGYLSRQMIKNGEARSYYRYRVVNLFLDSNGKNYGHKKIPTGSTSPNLPQGGEAPPALPGISIPISLAQSQANEIARAAAQPTGDLNQTTNGVEVDSRKVVAWKKCMRDSLLFEDTEKVIEERKARKIDTAPRKTSSRAALTKDWKGGKCSQVKALAWIEEHPEGKILAARLIDLTNQDEWSAPLARMLYRRWRSGEITLSHVTKLMHVMPKHYTELSLRWLLQNVVEIIRKNQRHFEETNHMMSFRANTFLNGDETKKNTELGTARSYLKRLASLDQLDYTTVFVNSPPSIARYALVYNLVDMGMVNMVRDFQHLRMSEIEDEMAKNLAVWKLYDQMYQADEELFFYDTISARMLRNHEKSMLHQECAVLGTTMTNVMKYLDLSTLVAD